MRNRQLFALLSLLLLAPLLRAQVFTDVSVLTDVDIGGNKDGGVSWGDFNGDGCPDLLVNTDDNAIRTRLLLSDCNLPNVTFTDVTATHGAGLLNATTERSAIWADFNNDGHLDFARNTTGRFEVYANKGPAAAPPYSFGDAAQNPNFVITAIANGMNTEGFGWMDYNNDGWLDLIVENHNFGIDIFENPADGSANFTHVTPNGGTMGLPTGGNTGDYMALSDYNNDGYVDILARKENEGDLWTNSGVPGAGQFAVNGSFNEQARNGNKGGVLMADFDNDGDFDIFWTDEGTNEIFLQTAPGVFAASGEPATSSGVGMAGANIDGCSVADVNHDGKVDLFLSNESGPSFLFMNNTPNGGALSFARNNFGIDVNADGEGTAFCDYDRDGDMDLYVNVKNGTNQLWRNQLNNTDFLKVRALLALGGGISRDDVGATVVLKDCNDNIVSGIRDVNGTRGHGSQDVPEIHFGLPAGPNVPYVVEVSFTRRGAARTVIQQAVIPSLLSQQTLLVFDTSSSDLSLCVPLEENPAVVLEVELNDAGPFLNWSVQNADPSSFVLEYSEAGLDFGELEYLESQTRQTFAKEGGFFRLKMLTKSGTTVNSNVVETRLSASSDLELYPHPVGQSGLFTVGVPGRTIAEIRMYDLQGRLIATQVPQQARSQAGLDLRIMGVGSGSYVIEVRTSDGNALRKLLTAR